MIKSKNNITRKVALVISDRAAHIILIEKILDNLKIKHLKASTIYEAERVFLQELPHLIISDSRFSDGTLVNLHSKLSSSEAFKKIPIIATLDGSKEKEADAIGTHKYNYISEGNIDPKELMENVISTFRSLNNLSPQFYSLDHVKFDRNIDIWVKANLLGKFESFLVINSNVYLDPRSSILIRPKDIDIEGINLSHPTNIKFGNSIINLFPISEIVDKNKGWLMNVPYLGEFDLAIAGGLRKIAIIGGEKQFKQLKVLLKGYNIDCQYYSDLQDFVSKFKGSKFIVECIYFSNDKKQKDFSIFEDLYHKTGIPVIIKTDSVGEVHKEGIYKIRPPFSLSTFVEMIRSLCIKGKEIQDNFDQKGIPGIEVSYNTVGDLIGLDERGGIIEMSFPLANGTSLNMRSSLLDEIWEGNASVEITGFSPMDENPDRWYMKFEKHLKGFSKGRYWSDILGKITEVVKR